MRAIIRQRLLEADPDAVLLPLDNEVGNVHEMGKGARVLFDPRQSPQFMRK